MLTGIHAGERYVCFALVVGGQSAKVRGVLGISS